MKNRFKKYCKDYENIENYQKALADNFKGWHCHHRLETHTSDGERRPVDITVAELQALNMYYNRPAEELIFLTASEHEAFNKGKSKSEESKKKMSKAKKGKYLGENNPMYGKRHSEESKKKMSEAKKGRYTGENNSAYGKHWYNNGKITIMSYECPPGFTTGRLRKY